MKPTRTERRQTAREARKLFERALQVASDVEAGLKTTVNGLPFLRRLLVACRILVRAWR